ncbi:hypothetical protein ES703_38289 [subsurface metagenome]
MKRAFTLVEVLIVVAILGILAAIALPTFQAHSQEAKEAAAKDNLRILRNAIELYAAQHNGVPPGYPADNPDDAPPFFGAFYISMVRANYISEIPTNPFNDLTTICMIRDEETFPEVPTGEYGWIYKPATKDFRIDWPGTDKDGVRYYDY